MRDDSGTQYGKRATVCVVDDDVTVLASLTSLLRPEFEVRVARSGREGLALVRSDPPDVVVLDVQMTDIDGLSVCRSIKADPLTASIPVVFLTAQCDDETELRGLEVGASDFIVKPARGPAAVARIRNLARMKRLMDQLRRESHTDALTGLANRTHFFETLQAEMLRARRQHNALALLMLDVDHFKLYNDHYGHVAGDRVLNEIGRLLQQETKRAGDLAGRLGGEEFAILLPQTDRAGAGAVARRLAKTLAKACIEHATSPTASTVTVSMGVALYKADGQEPADTADDAVPLSAAIALIESADNALYEAKRHGRNRVCLAHAS